MTPGSRASHGLSSSELTPIRIRGKIPVRKRFRSKTESSTKRLSRSRYQPSRSGSEMGSKQRRDAKIRSHLGEKVDVQRRHMSRLEALPVELIEKIFLDCLEF